MLRPATPLTIILFAAFALLLLSVLSTPIIKAIPLGTYEDASYGVFGYCEGGKCSPIEIGYDTLFSRSARQGNDYSLPGSTRTTLSAILIVHPVACLLTLIMLGLAIASHFHAPSHSSRYLLAVFIFSIITFLVCLLAFLIDVLLFVPHMAWGSYIVLAATILDFLSLVVACAMRRTLVGRKARKKRIADNAEMSGENYYNRQAQQDAATAAVSALAPATLPPTSSHEGSDKPGTFATYDQKVDDRGSDERMPLTQRSTSDRSRTNPLADQNASEGGYGSPQRSGSGNSPPRDQYGNVIYSPEDPYGVRRGPSTERMNPRGRGGPMGGPRGRGGYGRGGYGAGMHAPPPARGGYGPPGRGAPGMRGGYGGPRGGYGGPMRGGRPPPPPGYAAGAYDRRPPPRNAYGAHGQVGQESYAPNRVENVGVGEQSRRDSIGTDLPRAESPPPLGGAGANIAAPSPVGQAVEMDATTGSPAHPPQGFGQYHNNGSNTSNTAIRDSDADVAGMLALQQARSDSPQLQPDTYMGGGDRLQPTAYADEGERLQPNTYSGGAGRAFNGPQRTDTYMSEASRYSQDESQYVPVRQGWGHGNNHNYSTATVPSPLDIPSQPKNNAQKANANVQSYYEDVDPRFVDAVPRASPPAQAEAIEHDDPHANAGARSPATSERSAFTSISQRGINPRWNPPPGQGYGQHVPQMPPPRKPVNKQENLNILNSNPDFQLPTARGGNSNRGAGGGMIPGSAYPGV